METDTTREALCLRAFDEALQLSYCTLKQKQQLIIDTSRRHRHTKAPKLIGKQLKRAELQTNTNKADTALSGTYLYSISSMQTSYFRPNLPCCVNTLTSQSLWRPDPPHSALLSMPRYEETA
jgi:hypothetical protein